ncbi:MAG: hypothetical protein KDB68_05015 [Planctomycetes bacterium]|nr:hypothetical protein [Planctomycetota bacterium]
MPDRSIFNQVAIKLNDASHGGGKPIPPALYEDRIWLRAAVKLDRSVVIGNLKEGNQRTPESIPQWPSPRDGKRVRFEIGTELPVYLPNRNDEWEYEIEHAGNQMLVANRMVKYRFTTAEDEMSGYQHFVAHHHFLPEITKKALGNTVFVDPMRTFVSMPFYVDEGSSNAVFESKFWKWSDKLLAGANAMLDAIRVCSANEQDFHLNTNSRPIFVVAAWLEGELVPGQIECHQVAGNVFEAALLPTSGFTPDQWKRVDAILSDQENLKRGDVALSQAKTFKRFGYLDLAVIHLCVAAESLLGAKYEQHLLSNGVPERSIRDRIREISTLSLLLSVHTYLFVDLGADQRALDAVKALNWARDCRNKVVHRGDSQREIDENRLNGAIHGLEYLRTLVGENTSETGAATSDE